MISNEASPTMTTLFDNKTSYANWNEKDYIEYHAVQLAMLYILGESVVSTWDHHRPPVYEKNLEKLLKTCLNKELIQNLKNEASPDYIKISNLATEVVMSTASKLSEFSEDSCPDVGGVIDNFLRAEKRPREEIYGYMLEHTTFIKYQQETSLEEWIRKGWPKRHYRSINLCEANNDSDPDTTFKLQYAMG